MGQGRSGFSSAKPQGQQPVPLILYPLGEQARQGSVPKGIVHWAMASTLVRPLPKLISTSMNSMRQS